MRGEWPITTVAAVSRRVTKGTTPTTIGGRFVGSGVAFVKVESITEDGRIDLAKVSHIDQQTNELLKRSILEEGDVLFTIAGTIGRVARVGPYDLPANTNQAVAIVRPDPRVIDSRFLYYVLRDKVRIGHALSRVVQSVQANFSLNELSAIELPLPSLGQQRAIAHILGSLDDKIELNRRMSETLEAMAQALFKSWFVDFDPVRAKAEGRSAGLAFAPVGLFPSRFVPSPLGDIPEGWEVGTLADIASLAIGGDWGADSASHDSEPAYCLRGVDLHRLRKEGWSAAPVRHIKRSSLIKRLPSPSDVLVEGSGECGRSLACGELSGVFGERFVYSNFCKRLHCGSEDRAYFVEYLLNRLVSSGEMKGYVTGTAMPNLDHKGLLSGLRLVLPPESVLRAFASFVQCARRRQYNSEARTLAQLRDTLLPRLVTGDHNLSDRSGFDMTQAKR